MPSVLTGPSFPFPPALFCFPQRNWRAKRFGMISLVPSSVHKMLTGQARKHWVEGNKVLIKSLHPRMASRFCWFGWWICIPNPEIVGYLTLSGEIARIASRVISLCLGFGWNEVGGRGLLHSEEQSCPLECHMWRLETRDNRNHKNPGASHSFLLERKKMKRKGGKEKNEWENS